MDFNFTTATCEHEEDSAPSVELSHLNQAGGHSSFGEKMKVPFLWEEGIRKSVSRCEDWKTEFQLPPDPCVSFPGCSD